MPPSDFATANIDDIVAQLTTEEAIQLIAGVGFWHTYAVPRLGIPSIKVSDGPNGIRGNHFFMGTPAKCLPSATALGATWDVRLIEQVGLKLLAREAKLRAASIALAPTCNIQRNPLGGRSFESFSEDPYLSGMIAAAYVKGIQSGGIGVAIKHFVANDKENDRMGYDSVLSERALREIYLMPFMLVQKLSKPWSVMTAYNRVNGTHASENIHLLRDVLRKEWGFEGLTMSDWFGMYSVDHGINAGLDLEMPGTNKWRTLELVSRSIAARKVTVRTIKERARKVLELVQRCAKEAPEVLDGDGQEYTRESEDDKILMRKVAAESIVLLRNENRVLPLKPAGLKKIAIVGANAKAFVLSGGGSAALKPSYFVSPYDGIVNALPKSIEVTYSEGARAFKTMPSLDFDLFTEGGERGWIGTWHKHEHDESMTPMDEPFVTRLIDETRIFVSLSAPQGITRRWTLRLRGQLLPRPYDTDFEFGLSVAGRAKLFVDGQLVIDNWTRQRRGDAFFGSGSAEEKGIVHLKANEGHSVYVEFCNVRGPADGDEDETVMDANPGVRLGGAEVRDPDTQMEEAVRLASEADVVIAVVGLNADWETEGYDRTTLSLPGRTDELIQKVSQANTKTIVVTESGSSITMPWAQSVAAIVHSWYLGNATGDAIADILFGTVNPSGKLSLTFPKREADLPSFGHFNSEDGKVHYAEDLFVGYKHYVHRSITPEFAFGHGLSYTTFACSDLHLSHVTALKDDINAVASVTVTNTGTVAGSEVVQLYTTLLTASGLTHPPLVLKAFAKVTLEPHQSKVVVLPLDKYAVSYWNERLERWIVEKGEYKVQVGTSSENLPLAGRLIIEKTIEWNGL
ncbi:glycoside hydrolase family 3 protein [Heterobasidion irregulare TC 32-1]|uniref:beta-glucosidase n=1 Tax=Heterobasidion irregulare (strain TC 32-1) TaxID=747525 RepID=W4KFV7_HETIT|nr:glycoside hydrolase family 3 protein [Heterobasidion irregulare TC 32-1]ETW84195.1 glycoside hydrolase family 3 protein [Heterobasidion irregulare TC 32-1]